MGPLTRAGEGTTGAHALTGPPPPGCQVPIADPFRWTRSLQLLDGEGLPVLEYPQSPGRMTPATARFYEAVVNGALTHSGDSRLARHVGNAVLREDARGARLAKERRDSPRRIDAAVAAVMAHDRAAALAGVTRDRIYTYARYDPGCVPCSRGRRPDPASRDQPGLRAMTNPRVQRKSTGPSTHEGTPTAGATLPPHRRTPPAVGGPPAEGVHASDINGPGVLPAGAVCSRVALERAPAGLRRFIDSEVLNRCL
jgi:Phage Terminase